MQEELSPITVEGGMQNSVTISCDDSAYLTVPKGEGGGLKQTLEIPETITAPVTKGDVIGSLRFTLGDEEIASFDITADEDVEEKDFGSILKLLFQSMVKL